MVELDRSLSSTSNASSESDWDHNDNGQIDEGVLVGGYDESTIKFNSNR